MDYSKESGEEIVTGQLVGAGLIWARATFDKKEPIQVNTWIKLTFEVFTRLKGNGVDLKCITAKFNEQEFDFTIGEHKLTRDKPLLIEQEIYLDEKLMMNGGEMLVLNQFILQLNGKPV